MLVNYDRPGRANMRATYVAHEDFAVNHRELSEGEVDALTAADNVLDVLAFGSAAFYDVSKNKMVTEPACLVEVWLIPEGDDEPDLGPHEFWVPERGIRMDPANPPSTTAHAPNAATRAAASTTSGHVSLTKPLADIIMADQFAAVHSNVTAFQRLFQAALDDNRYPAMDGGAKDDATCAAQLRANIAPDIRKCLIAVGGRKMTCTAIFAWLADEYPSVRNGASRRQQLAQERCTNRESAPAFAANMQSQFLESYDVETVEELQQHFGDKHAEPVFQALGLLLIGSIAPDAQASIAMDEAALSLQCTNADGLQKVRRAITTEYVARTKHTGGGSRAAPVRANVLTVDTATNRLITELTAKVAALEAAASAPRPKDRPGREWTSALSKCKWCKDSPVAIGGGVPGGHYHSSCPKQGNESE
jgi:hypothetical protein